MRTFGGGVKARRGPLGAATGNSTAVFTSAATGGPSGSAATRGSSAAFTGGATNGRTTFGGATATTLGSGRILGAATSGSDAQISGAGRASSLAPATIVCAAFTRARGTLWLRRASASVSAGVISGSFSRKLYQTILFSFGRISRS
jgi:hypothetical protein